MTRQQRRASQRELKKYVALYEQGLITKPQLDQYARALGFVKREELARAEKKKQRWAKIKNFVTSFGGLRARLIFLAMLISGCASTPRWPMSYEDRVHSCIQFSELHRVPRGIDGDFFFEWPIIEQAWAIGFGAGFFHSCMLSSDNDHVRP